MYIYHIILSLSVIFLAWEFVTLCRISTVHSVLVRMRDTDVLDYNNYLASLSLLHCAYLIWCIVGIFTPCGPLFLFLFIIRFFVPIAGKGKLLIGTFLSITLILTILLLTYHNKLTVSLWSFLW